MNRALYYCGVLVTLLVIPSVTASGCAWVSNPTNITCPGGCTFVSAMNLCYDATCPTHTSESACSAVSGCSWAHGKCRDYNLWYGTLNCTLSTSEDTCAGISCYLSRNGTCISGSANSACAWLAQHDINTCPLRCEFNVAIGLCYEKSCVNFTSQNTCESSLGCAWTNNKCFDYNIANGNYSCSEVSSADQCAGNCQWSSSQGRCISGSASQACAWLSQGSDIDCPDRCTYDSGVGLCYEPRCANFTTAQNCSYSMGCSWHDNKCWDYNIAYGSYSCKLATKESVCGGSCQWNNKTGKCIPGSASTPCPWLPQGDADLCPLRCTFNNGTGVCHEPSCSTFGENDCPSDKGCSVSNGQCWDYNVAYGSYPCNMVTSQDECASSCQWSGGKCIRGSSNSPCAWLNQDADSCPTPRCTWKDGINKCYDSSCVNMTEDTCSLRPGCVWHYDKCQDYNVAYGSYNCSGASSAAECGGRCQWNNITNKCIFGSANQACAWLTQGSDDDCPSRCTYATALGICYEPKCKDFTEATCSSQMGCAFDAGQCLDYNLQYGDFNCTLATQNTCGGHCFWSETNNKCEYRRWVATGCTTSDVDAQMQSLQVSCSSQMAAFDSIDATTPFNSTHAAAVDICYGSCAIAYTQANCTVRAAEYAVLCNASNICGMDRVAALKLLQCDVLESADPSVSNEDACSRASNCRYVASTNKCVPSPSSDLLQKVCEPCVREYLALDYAALVAAGGSVDTSLLDLYDQYCTRTPSQFCYALDVSKINVTDPRSLLTAITPSELSTVCANVATRQCYRKIIAQESHAIVQLAQVQFANCLASAQNDTSAQNGCQFLLMQANQMSYTIDAFLENMCSQNGQGQYCLALPQQLNSDAQVCFQSITSGVACSSACNITLASAFASWGCCAATLQNIFGDVPADSSALTQALISGSLDVVVTTTVPQGALQGFMWGLETCGGAIAENITTMLSANICAPSNNGSVANLVLDLGIPYSLVAEDQSTSTDLLDTIQNDLSVRLGVSTGAIVDVVIVEDSNHQVSTNVGGSTANQRLASVATWRRVTFTSVNSAAVQLKISTGNADDNNAVASDFSFQQQQGTLALRSSEKLLQRSCGSCGVADALSVAANVNVTVLPPTVSPSPTLTSSASTTAYLTVLFSVLLLALIL